MRARAAILGALVLCVAAPALAQRPAPAADSPTSPASVPAGAPGSTSFLAQNVTRAELWRFFEPPPGGGMHPDYQFVGSRFTLGARYSGPRWALRGALQYVRLENLPAGAIGPGLFGTGGAYFLQAGGTFSYQFYLRNLSVAFTAADSGLWVEAGRFSRTADDEPASGDAAIDTLARVHLSGRLLGDMEWSMYQRAWDGVRGGLVRRGWRTTITAAMPTQGTYEESANLTMEGVRVGAVEVRADPDTLTRHTSLGAFVYVYDDRRRIAARPDNQVASPQRPVATPTRADVRIGTAGVSAIGAYPHGGGRWDGLAWIAAQAGDWYGQRHRALAATGQAGYQWTRAPWRPWLRAGVDYASGDADAADDAHGTFFPMLPSGNQQARSNTYALMNVVDAWVETRVTPARAVDALVTVHRVGLATRADWWYSGSGATERRGNYFGFHARNNAGGRRLGTVIEGEVAWRATRWWTLRGYAGRMAGGDVVRNRFAGHRLFTAWLESVLSF